MIRRILLELALFLLPFALFFLYRAASRTMSVRDRWPLTRLALVGAGLAIAALIIVPLLSPGAGDKCYRAPRYENGVEVKGGMVDCESIAIPTRPGQEPSVRPVSPRDERAQ
jgi:hypothetical protein